MIVNAVVGHHPAFRSPATESFGFPNDLALQCASLAQGAVIGRAAAAGHGKSLGEGTDGTDGTGTDGD